MSDTVVTNFSEYDPLKKVVLCSPTFMEISKVINDTQKHYIKENIDKDLACQQHDAFIKTLKQHNVEVILLPAKEKYPEQVFTRDIAFTLGNDLFIAEMGRKIRQGEEKVLEDWLHEQQVSYTDLKEDSIEGGDVLIDRDTIWIGISDRTTMKSAEKLQSLLPKFKVIPVPIAGEYLHLDCVFNVISEKEALIYPPALQDKELKILNDKYELIEVSDEEQFTLGTNVFLLGNKKVVSLPINKHVNHELKQRGFDIIEVDISEIIKSGGSFRCITMPITRSKQ